MIEVESLTKKYGENTAISDLTFSIDDGHIYGFLGPNGAGKSTTMNIITGCLAATHGSVKIDGYDIFESPVEAKSKIGYLPEQPPLYQDMTPKEYLKFVAEAKKISKDQINNAVAEVMNKTQINDVGDRLIKNLSKGYKQRVGIAQALLGNPSTIILDEPTVGLDPNQIIEIRALISELGKSHTIILSSHILSEVQAVCDKIMIISKGKMVANDTPEGLEKLFAGKTELHLSVKGPKSSVDAVIGGIHEITDFTSEEKDGITFVTADCANETNTEEKLFFAFADIKMPIIRMTAERASLEDIFIELTKSDNTADEDEIIDLSADYAAAAEAEDNPQVAYEDSTQAAEETSDADIEEGTEQ